MTIATAAPKSAPTPPSTLDDRDAQLRAFGDRLDALKERVSAEIGSEDLIYIRRVRGVSRFAEWTGRALIHLSFEPLGFLLGVGSLWVHKQLEATEIGHTALHGAYDGIEGAERYESKTFHWKVPIDERSWHRGHNGRHHGATNVAGRDADIHFGPVRLTEHTPHHVHHYWQLPFALLVLWPNFTFGMNLHFTGAADYLYGNDREDGFDFIHGRTPATRKDVLRRTFRKFVPYYFKEYVALPLLAGPFFWKTMLGNWMSEVMRDVYSAATIFCGHVGEDTAEFEEGTRPASKGHWYAMQVEASNNFVVPWVLSVFCGGLDLQIEHHLFPKFAPERLRQVAPEVEALCAEYGVEYRRDSWPRTLKKALARIAQLSRPTAAERALPATA